MPLDKGVYPREAPFFAYAAIAATFPLPSSLLIMSRFPGRGFGLFAVAAACGVAVLAACGGGTKESSKADDVARVASCRRGDTTATYVAYREFIKATTPTAQRFLTAAGTDSAAPDDGFRAMQDKGPSYFYGGDSAAKQQIREKLASVGPYASLLIVQRAADTSARGDTVRVTLGGHFIGGELEGKVAATKRMSVACADSGWKLVNAADLPTP